MSLKEKWKILPKIILQCRPKKKILYLLRYKVVSITLPKFQSRSVISLDLLRLEMLMLPSLAEHFAVVRKRDEEHEEAPQLGGAVPRTFVPLGECHRHVPHWLRGRLWGHRARSPAEESRLVLI